MRQGAINKAVVSSETVVSNKAKLSTETIGRVTMGIRQGGQLAVSSGAGGIVNGQSCSGRGGS